MHLKLLAPALALLGLSSAVGAGPTLKKSTWRGLEAFTLTDGKSEAVVVPKLGGRVTEFRRVGGANWLWLGEPGAEQREPAQFWGGEKTYIGPHTAWRFTQPRTWPPPAPDSTEHTAEALDDGTLRVTSPPWEGYDSARIVREFRFAPGGEFVIHHRIAPVPGSRAVGALWTIAQTVPATVFVPLNPVSPYKDNVFWFDCAKPAARAKATLLSPTLLRIELVPGEIFKMGAHPPQPALAVVRDGSAFVQKADPQPKSDYPEGADGAGLSVEVYHHDAPGAGEYVELEFLSPLGRLDRGVTLTTRWSIHALPADWNAKSVEILLIEK